ncbi:MAG: porphobilinogen synthase [Thermoleophilia bacterium]|nr:porphobilinogen synthase [Thermoleophilia bacterium]
MRHRRLRRSEGIRRLVREVGLRPSQLILPLFAVHGEGVHEPVDSLPGVARMSPDLLADEARRAHAAGIGGVLLFGVTDQTDTLATSAHAAGGVVQTAVRAIKTAVPDLVVVTDVCLCAYTDHGHCGLLDDAGEVANDPSLDVLARVAVSHADAGADIVAPSDMMDGRVAAIRSGLDVAGHEAVSIMAYSAKYASAFYGPFRDAAGSAPAHGDRRGYQMDPPNIREALREVRADEAEGADMVMVKPAATYLDVIHAVRGATDLPVAAYHVSGEYAMIKAAADRGWLDGQSAMMETLTAIARAGADIIITYAALDVAAWLREDEV